MISFHIWPLNKTKVHHHHPQPSATPPHPTPCHQCHRGWSVLTAFTCCCVNAFAAFSSKGSCFQLRALKNYGTLDFYQTTKTPLSEICWTKGRCQHRRRERTHSPFSSSRSSRGHSGLLQPRLGAGESLSSLHRSLKGK